MKPRLSEYVDRATLAKVSEGFEFTEGPLWDPRGFFHFVDPLRRQLYRIVAGSPATVVHASMGTGLTFDSNGDLIQCEAFARRVARWNAATQDYEVLVDSFEGKRFNRPNDLVCASDGSIYFTDPDRRTPIRERELDSAVWRVRMEGTVELVGHCEYPNGLAFSPDESRLYVANTRYQRYLHVFDLEPDGTILGRRIFADMSGNDAPGAPDGVKVDVEGNVYCTGPGGIWVLAPDGTHLATVEFPEPAVNMAFGGEDMKTLLVCAHHSVYTIRTHIAGLRCPCHRTLAQG